MNSAQWFGIGCVVGMSTMAISAIYIFRYILTKKKKTIPEIKYKQFVIIPKKPRMSKGKIASQACHATFMALEKTNKEVIKEWKLNGMCVIVLQCKTPLELFGIAKYLDQWKVVNHLYIDEGLTEVEMGTPTALATGVLPEEYFWMLSQLKLYRG